MRRPMLVASTTILTGVVCCATLTLPAQAHQVATPARAMVPTAADGRQSREDEAIARAEANVTRHPATFGFGTGQELQVRDVLIDQDGTEHVRFDRTYRGLPVIGGDFVVHQGADGRLKGASRAKAGAVALKSVTPTVSAARTETLALSHAPGITAAEATSELVVWAADGTPRLAWRTTVRGVGSHGQPDGVVIVTDATTGKIIEEYDAEREARGVGRSEYTGSVQLDTTLRADGTFTLLDPVRGHVTKDALNKPDDSLSSQSGALFTRKVNIWGDGKKFSTDRTTAAVDAHANTAWTYDYYKTSFGRNGIKNDGKGATLFVHVGRNWDNAAWYDDCFCMMSGDGDGRKHPEQVDLDTMGHEMTHGVTSATANLRYVGESGGLNEATSDIFGTMVEWHADNPIDRPDYLFSDQSTPPWARRFDKPSLDGGSADYWSRNVGRLDVHYSSGVGNHFFYLLSEGSGARTIRGVRYDSPTYDGSAITGIGNKKAAAIWYRALTTYMTSTTDYKAARTATLNAAKDLFGTGSTEYRTVQSAWTAVNVR
ncbi:M4 family metallopeptidase [Streptomyces lavendofoliae]|uniref:M4 family metallopeptidase n=1 Tax=Streptomyces lavendofoliae TaxID=67314 RepID=UPI003D8F7EA2